MELALRREEVKQELELLPEVGKPVSLRVLRPHEEDGMAASQELAGQEHVNCLCSCSGPGLKPSSWHFPND